MQTQAGKAPHPLVWIAAIALIVICGLGIAVLMGWLPALTGGSGDSAAISSSVIRLNA
jgi:hypothetical protein